MKTVEVEFLMYDYWNNEEIGPSIDAALALAKKGFTHYTEIGDSNTVILMFTKEELDDDIQAQLKLLKVSDEESMDEYDDECDDDDAYNVYDEEIEEGNFDTSIVTNGGEFTLGNYNFIHNKQ